MKHVNGFIEKVELAPNVLLMASKSVFNLFPAELSAMTADGKLISSITVIDDKLKDLQVKDSLRATAGHYIVSTDISSVILYSLGVALQVFTDQVVKALKKDGEEEDPITVFETILELVQTWIETDERTGVRKEDHNSSK